MCGYMYISNCYAGSELGGIVDKPQSQERTIGEVTWVEN